MVARNLEELRQWRENFDRHQQGSVTRGNTRYWIDFDTGEILDQGKITSHHHYTHDLRIYETVLSGISRSRPMTGESAKVFLYLLGKVGADNHIPGPSQVARELGLLQPHVSRAYSTLLVDGYLVKDDDGYGIHPFICYRGSEFAREAAIKKVLNKDKLNAIIRQSEAETEEYISKRRMRG